MLGNPSGPGAGVTPKVAAPLRARIGLKDMTAALKAYREKNNKLPQELEKLVEEGFLPYLPVPPADSVFEIDKKAVEVKIVSK